MRRLIYLIGISFLASHCTPEFVPDSILDDESNAIILPTGDPNGRKGEVEASFLSSQNKFTFSESTMSSETFRVSYVTTAKTLLYLNGFLKAVALMRIYYSKWTTTIEE